MQHRYQQSFHGVDLAGLRQAAVKEYFKQPIVVSGKIVVIAGKYTKMHAWTRI